MVKGTFILEGAKLEPRELNWAGQPIRPGEGYGGDPKRIPQPSGSPKVLGRRFWQARRQSEVMKERWKLRREEMLLKVIGAARAANLKAGRKRKAGTNKKNDSTSPLSAVGDGSLSNDT